MPQQDVEPQVQALSRRERSQVVSATAGALIASCSLVLGVAAMAILSAGGSPMVIGLVLLPAPLILVALVVHLVVVNVRRRKNLPVRPAPIPLVIWSVVGVPVLPGLLVLITALGSGGDEYSLAGAWVLAIFMSLHGLWIAAVIAIITALVIVTRERKDAAQT